MKYYWTHFSSCSSHTNNRQTHRSSKREHPKWGGEPRQCLEKCIIRHSAASSFGVTLFHPQLRGLPTGCIDCRSHACSSSLSGLRAHVIDGTISSFVTFTFITAALADYFYGSVKGRRFQVRGTPGEKICSIQCMIHYYLAIPQMVTLADLCWEGKRFNHRCKKVEASYSSVARAVMALSPWLEKHSFWFVNVERKTINPALRLKMAVINQTWVFCTCQLHFNSSFKWFPRNW